MSWNYALLTIGCKLVLPLRIYSTMSHKSLFSYTSINGWSPYELLISERDRKTDKVGFIRAYISELLAYSGYSSESNREFFLMQI